MKPAVFVLPLLSLALAACDAGNGDPAAGGSCVGSFAGGAVTQVAGGCSICGTRDGEQAVDGQRGSFASVQLAGGELDFRATAPAGVVFPAGNFAGALMLIPQGYSPQTTWVVTTYLGGVPQESRTPANAEGDDPANPTGTDDYYGFRTALAFDAVEFRMSGGSPGINGNSVPDVRVYEFCGAK